MGKTRIIELSDSEREDLEKGYHFGFSSAFRKRCHVILLKSTGRTSSDVGSIVGMHQVSVNTWLNRYQASGIDGLKTKPGRGRKSILDPEKDLLIVEKAVKSDRQRLDQAKILIEKQTQKQFSKKTLQRFLKNLSADTEEFG
jgi:transposase